MAWYQEVSQAADGVSSEPILKIHIQDASAQRAPEEKSEEQQKSRDTEVM